MLRSERIFFIKPGNVITTWNKVIKYMELKHDDNWWQSIHDIIPELEPYHILMDKGGIILSEEYAHPFTYGDYLIYIFLRIKDNDLQPIIDSVANINTATELGLVIHDYIMTIIQYEKFLLDAYHTHHIDEVFIIFLEKYILTNDNLVPRDEIIRHLIRFMNRDLQKHHMLLYTFVRLGDGKYELESRISGKKYMLRMDSTREGCLRMWFCIK